MLPTLQIGPLAIQAPGFFLLVGVWLGLVLAEKYAPDRKINPTQINSLMLNAMLIGIISARLAYVIRFPEAFLANPMGILSLNASLLDPLAGFSMACVYSYGYLQRRKLPTWAVLDALTPAFATLALAIGLSHLASGQAFGSPTELPWGIWLWGSTRHPSQIYEILAAGIILIILWPGRKILKERPEGVFFVEFISLSAGSRLFLDAFRGDSLMLPGGFRLAQVIAWFILALSLWMRHRLMNTRGQKS
ncbi:MAG: prolipoprotein diacylglyceryl transferase [Anaerolineales bacterium]|nr:prolipoprotein diacylglyceryl transferase [Anaerolineales bacterium]